MRSELKSRFNLEAEVLSASTGVIGRKLPVDKIVNSISEIASRSKKNTESIFDNKNHFEEINNFDKSIHTKKE